MPQWSHKHSVNTAPGYAPKVLKTAAANLVAYWPMWETAGSTAEDVSPNNYHGAYTGVTLGQTGIGDGRTCPLFDGTNDFNNVYSTGLAAAFNGAEGTLMIWAQVAGSSVWTDAAERILIRFTATGTNIVYLQKPPASNILTLGYIAGGVAHETNTALSATSFFAAAVTWSASADEKRQYVDGAAVGSVGTGLGTWNGTLVATTSTVGALNTTPGSVWSGTLAHAALWNTPLSAAQISFLSKP